MEPIISAKVFVGNLNYRTSKDELQEFLGAAGEIVDCFLPTDRETGRPRGFAFVTFADEAAAAACIEQFDGAELSGRRLNINPAEERGRRGGPGGGGGRRDGGRRGERSAPVTEMRRGGRRDGGRRDGGGGRDGGGRDGGGRDGGGRDGGGRDGGRRRFGDGEGGGRRREFSSEGRGRREEGEGGASRRPPPRGGKPGGGGRRFEQPAIPEIEYDTSDRRFAEEEYVEGSTQDEWGKGPAWARKKKKRKGGSRRGLRAKKRSI